MNAGRLIAACVACLICSAPAPAQRLAYLYGRVLDPSEAAVTEAVVTVVNDETIKSATACRSDSSSRSAAMPSTSRPPACSGWARRLFSKRRTSTSSAASRNSTRGR